MKTKILFEDEHILVVYKPAGIATQAAGTMQMDVVSELRNYLMLTKNKNKGCDNTFLKNRNDAGKEPYIGLVHRLDQPVEGILVFAKTSEAAAALSKQAADRSLKKEYLAAVLLENHEKGFKAHKENEMVVLTDYLLKDGRTNTSKVVSSWEKNAKKAVLSYSIMKIVEMGTDSLKMKTENPTGTKLSGKSIGLLKIQLETGRHHQIRVQSANGHMPLLGDLKYGSEESKKVSEALGIRDVALCARKLIFKHPKTGKSMEFSISPQKGILNILTV